MTRKERDSLGELELPDEAYYGVQTARALENFPVSGQRERPEFIRAFVLVKKAAALSNMELGVLDNTLGKAIIQAADEVLGGRFLDQFVVDVFQAGAGTSFNMNVNEVLANRALEVLGISQEKGNEKETGKGTGKGTGKETGKGTGKGNEKETGKSTGKGDHHILSPNDHVNMAQSSNDSFPTACHVALVHVTPHLLESLFDLARTFEDKGKAFRNIPKSGRTHLMDATPLSLGDEFLAYASSLRRAAGRIQQRRDDLLELPIGGTAVGNGVNTHPDYRATVIKQLNTLTRHSFYAARNSHEALQSRAQMSAYSSALRELALELIRIANDLRLLGSGPTTGLDEIRLPSVQPGSSIMPAKVNPVIAECLTMICFHVIGNDTTVSFAAQAGQLDLNVMTPVMIHNLLESVALLTSYLPVFRERCVKGIRANREKCTSYLELNPSLATLLNPRIGYALAAELAKEAFDRGISVKHLSVEKGILTQEEADELFDPKKAAQGRYENE